MEIKSIKILIVLVICTILSCNNEKNYKKIFTYNIYDKNNKIKGFIKRVVMVNGKLRTDSVITMNKNKKVFNSYKEKFLIKKNGLKNFKTNSNYIVLNKKDSCYNYFESQENSYKICFIEKSTYEINGYSYKNVYKFKISNLSVDGVSRFVYFNKDFIPLKEIYIDGYTPYFNSEIVSGFGNETH